MFCYENEMVFPIYVSDKNFEDSMDLLLLINDNKPHYVYIKDFNTFMFHFYQKTKIKNGFVEAAYTDLVVKVC